MKGILNSGIVILFLCFAGEYNAQKLTASNVLKNVYVKLQSAKDYSVNALVRVDIPFIKAMPSKAVIYFKQKDKFKVQSKGISIIPRQGFNQLARILRDSSQYICMEQGFEIIDSTQTTIINVVSLSDTSDLLLGKLWIDTKKFVVLRSQLTTRSNGTILIEYKYASQLKFGLPDKLVFTVDVRKFRIPKVLAADINSATQEKDSGKEPVKKGKVYITLSEYSINKGIPDNFFSQK